MTDEQRWNKYIEQGGRCKTCGRPAPFRWFEGAHKIPRTKKNLERFGSHVIDHPLNIDLTCPGRCNDASLMNFTTRPVEAYNLIEEIHEAIKRGFE